MLLYILYYCILTLTFIDIFVYILHYMHLRFLLHLLYRNVATRSSTVQCLCWSVSYSLSSGMSKLLILLHPLPSLFPLPPLTYPFSSARSVHSSGKINYMIFYIICISQIWQFVSPFQFFRYHDATITVQISQCKYHCAMFSPLWEHWFK